MSCSRDPTPEVPLPGEAPCGSAVTSCHAMLHPAREGFGEQEAAAEATELTGMCLPSLRSSATLITPTDSSLWLLGSGGGRRRLPSTWALSLIVARELFDSVGCQLEIQVCGKPTTEGNAL